jgi:glucose/arabinose dehydrogenase
MKNRRGTLLLLGIGVLAIGVALWLTVRVRQALAPAANSAQTAQEGKLGAPDLQRQIMADKLNNVWDVAFLPDDTMLFAERAGTISKLVKGQKVELLKVPNLFAAGEGGLMGLTVDPQFADNRFIYACYDTPQDVRVSRWKVSADASTLTDKTDILTGIKTYQITAQTPTRRHSGCRPRFGADGNLWIGTGDSAIYTNPQDPKSLAGKVLRIDRDGKPASDNLGGTYDPRIYSIGHRNIQGMAMFQVPRNGVYGYSVEHGPDKEDELNKLVKGNMGWDPGRPSYNENVPMTDKTKYPDAIDAVWNSGDKTIAPSGMSFISGIKWKNFNGRLAMAILKDKQVRLLEIINDKIISEQILFEGEFGRLRSAVMGPNDDLYLTTDNGSGQDKIIRISPQ